MKRINKIIILEALNKYPEDGIFANRILKIYGEILNSANLVLLNENEYQKLEEMEEEE